MEARDLNLDPILELLRLSLNPYAVYVFGSFARDEMRPDSDLDLAILTDESPSSYTLFQLAQEAADLLNRDVDLVDLSAAETVFQAQVVSSGYLVVNRHRARVIDFQIRTLKEYALLNEERRAILQRIQEEGSLYA